MMMVLRMMSKADITFSLCQKDEVRVVNRQADLTWYNGSKGESVML